MYNYLHCMLDLRSLCKSFYPIAKMTNTTFGGKCRQGFGWGGGSERQHDSNTEP